jgi:hypothetical protein
MFYKKYQNHPILKIYKHIHLNWFFTLRIKLILIVHFEHLHTLLNRHSIFFLPCITNNHKLFASSNALYYLSVSMVVALSSAWSSQGYNKVVCQTVLLPRGSAQWESIFKFILVIGKVISLWLCLWSSLNFIGGWQKEAFTSSKWLSSKVGYKLTVYFFKSTRKVTESHSSVLQMVLYYTFIVYAF